MRREIGLRPLSPTFGAVVDDVDISQELPDDVVSALHAALLEYKVIFFPEQGLSHDEQFRFACRFGAPYDYSGKPLGEADSAEETEYEEGRPVEIVPYFHSDYMYRAEGPAYSALQMLERPDVGGDTIFADLCSSYEVLSPHLRGLIEPLTAVHVHPRHYFDDASLIAAHKKTSGEDLSATGLARLRERLVPTEHPLVRTIPETGKTNYWLSERHTRSIKELPAPESDAILKLLFAHQLRPEFLIRWRWTTGDVALWDNRTTLHAGIRDYASGRRAVRRVSVGPNCPVGAGAGTGAAGTRAD